MKITYNRAFTLVELSIVLVIIGLLTAGVVGGQSLIQSAKISSQVSQITQMKTAVNAFKLEYDALPGDMKDATAYWGAYGVVCNNENLNVTTCNGDGSGKIDMCPTCTHLENALFFHHLKNSGILTNYLKFGASYDAVMKAKIVENSYITVGLTSTYGISANSSHFYIIANGVMSEDGMMLDKVVPTKISATFDTKLDDGFPTQGSVRYLDVWESPACATSTTPPKWNVSNTTEKCTLIVDGP